MNKIMYIVVMMLILFTGCSNNKDINTENPPSQSNVSLKEDSKATMDNAEGMEQKEDAPQESTENHEMEKEEKELAEKEKPSEPSPGKVANKLATANEEKDKTSNTKEKQPQQSNNTEKVEKPIVKPLVKPVEEQKDIEKLKINENTESAKMYVVASSLNMRAYMSTEDSNVIKVLSKGTEVKRLAQKDDWSKIELSNGVLGYVKSKHLSSEKPAETTVTSNTNHWKYERQGLKIEINKYKEYLEGGNVVYWVAEIKSDNINKDINTAFAGGSYSASVKTKQRTSTLAKNNNAILAINGDASGFRPPSNAFHNPVMIRNGKVEYDLIVGKSIGKMGALTSQGRLVIFDPKDYSSTQQMLDEGFTDTWWFDVALVINGQVQNIYDGNQTKYKAPYSAIGQKADGTMLFITVDGRGSNGSSGLNYGGMARLMGRYGAYNAYQLDGGGSATMVFNGNVLNKPSDGSERAISDIIYVGR